MKRYKIPFVGLKQGLHHYEYEIGDDFFENIQYSPISSAKVVVNVELLKQDTLLILDFKLHGTVNVTCDRCLEKYDQPIINDYRLIVKFGTEEMEESDEIIVLPSDAYELDLEQYIYEYINLSLPLRKVHPDDSKGNSGCDPEVMRILNTHHYPASDGESGDPRWDELKKLFKKN